jgi:hypothetical protein
MILGLGATVARSGDGVIVGMDVACRWKAGKSRSSDGAGGGLMRPQKTTLLAEAAPVGWRERPEPVWIPARLMGAGHSASSTRGTAVASGPKGEGVGVGVGVPSGSTIIGGRSVGRGVAERVGAGRGVGVGVIVAPGGAGGGSCSAVTTAEG